MRPDDPPFYPHLSPLFAGLSPPRGFGALLRFGVIRHVYERLDLSRRATSAARVGGGINIPPLQLPAQRAMEPAAHLAGAGVPA
jgi:hypothetical protein